MQKKIKITYTNNMKRILYTFLNFINVIIIIRLSFLCFYKKDYYNKLLYDSSNVIIEGMTAPRGRILDANGNILVDNKGVKSIIYNKLNISTKEELEIAKTLSDDLEIVENVSDYDLKYYYYLNNKDYVDGIVSDKVLRLYKERKITSEDLLNEKLNLITNDMLNNIDKTAAYYYYLLNNGYSYQDKIIKENISDEEYILINNLNLKGVRTDITWERIYPYKEVLKDVFGLVSDYNQGLPREYKNEYLKEGYKLNDRVGVSNLEYIYDKYLKGEKAKYKVTNNKLELVSTYEKGKDIVLSIDINLQIEIEKILEKEMINAKNGVNSKYFDQSYVVVSNPNTGGVIALIGKKINDDESFNDYSYYNAINSYGVGSVVKGATISVGYKNNIIDEKTSVYDSCIKLYGQKEKCSWSSSIGRINDINALKMSSNYFQYLIAIGLTGKKYTPNMKINATKEHFAEYRSVLGSYGFGNITGIDLSKEGKGMKSETITDDLLLNMAVGHYDTYTPISLAQYINTIASGKRRQLSLLKSVISADGSIFYEKENDIYNDAPVEEKYLNRIREGFKEVNARGTAYSYTNHKFSSAGKTGTSDTYLDTDLDGKIDTFTTTTSYVMYAPYEKREISIAIVSPNISYKNNNSKYRYPINSKVSREITNLLTIID